MIARDVFVLYAGSSSLTFQIFTYGTAGLERQIKGRIDGIGVRSCFSAIGKGGEGLIDQSLGAQPRRAGRPATHRTASRRYLAASHARLGRVDDARNEAALVTASNPKFTISHWVYSTQFEDEATKAHFIEGYRLAGRSE